MGRWGIGVCHAVMLIGLVGCEFSRQRESADLPTPQGVAAKPVRANVQRYTERNGWVEGVNTVEVLAPGKGILAAPRLMNRLG